jgi:hypothetical protein
MRDNKRRSALCDLGHILLNNALALVVERACRLVEDKNARVGNQCAGDGDPLPLAPRQAGAALADNRVIAFWEFENELVGPGELRCGDDPLGRHRRIDQSDVVPDRAVKQDVLLQHDPICRTQPGRIDLRQVDPVDQHPAALGQPHLGWSTSLIGLLQRAPRMSLSPRSARGNPSPGDFSDRFPERFAALNLLHFTARLTHGGLPHAQNRTTTNKTLGSWSTAPTPSGGSYRSSTLGG